MGSRGANLIRCSGDLFAAIGTIVLPDAEVGMVQGLAEPPGKEIFDGSTADVILQGASLL